MQFITRIINQKLWVYKAEETIYLGVRERKILNITALQHSVNKLDKISVCSNFVLFSVVDKLPPPSL
jgi:hypothetical protein